jgi:hypothetical protein
MSKQKTKTISYLKTIRFDSQTYQKIVKTAYKYDLKFSQVVKVIIGKYYETEKRSLSNLSESPTSSRNKRKRDL